MFTVDEIREGDKCPYCMEPAIVFGSSYAVQCPGCQADLCNAEYLDPDSAEALCLVDADGYADVLEGL